MMESGDWFVVGVVQLVRYFNEIVRPDIICHNVGIGT